MNRHRVIEMEALVESEYASYIFFGLIIVLAFIIYFGFSWFSNFILIRECKKGNHLHIEETLHTSCGIFKKITCACGKINKHDYK